MAQAKLDLSDKIIKKAIQNAYSPLPKTSTEKIFLIKIVHNSVLTENWAKSLCLKTAETISSIYGEQTKNHCALDNGRDPYNDSSLKLKNKPDFELILTRDMDNSIGVILVNLSQKDKNFTNKVGWVINNNSPEDFQNILKDRLTSSYFAINNLEIIRNVLVDLIYKSYKPDFNKNDNFTRNDLYSDLKQSKLWNPKTRRFLTAGSELLATLSFGWYGYHYLSSNQQDFDYEQEGIIKSLQNKFTGGHMVRYDDNSWNTNKNHVYAGVVYYLECRGAGLTALESYMCALAGSVAWEAVVEWREVFSVNDQIFTTHGGAILAESIHQLGNYIDQKGPPWFKNSIGWLWRGPKKAVQLYNSKILSGVNSDLDAEDPLLSGKFEFEIGTVNLSNGVNQKRVGFNNEVVTIPFMAEEGHEVKFIRDVIATDFSLNAPMDAILNEYDVFAKVVMAAYYKKAITADKNGQLNGYSFYVGPSSAITIKNDYSSKNDFMGIVHVLGTSAKLINFYKGFKITSTLDFWGDSVMMKSMMVEKYQAANPHAEIVENLSRSNYFHGFGYTSKGQVLIEFGNTTFGANYSFTSSFNTNQRQRDLNKILARLDISRKYLESEFFIERKITKSLKIKFALAFSKNNERISGFGEEKKYLTTRKVYLTYHF